MDFMGFVPGGRGGFFSRCCRWVSCGRGGGDGFFHNGDGGFLVANVVVMGFFFFGVCGVGEVYCGRGGGDG